jgi:NAD(P)-dependent dehydrogenase (short-subunit alcohol dehydrogenase family)
MKKLDNKVAVITGGTSGMRLATAKRFVAEGAYVFIMGRRQRELDAAVKDIGTHVTGVQGDIAKLTDLDRLYEIVKAQKSAISGLGRFEFCHWHRIVRGWRYGAGLTEVAA